MADRLNTDEGKFFPERMTFKETAEEVARIRAAFPDPRPKLEAEMVEAARRVICDALEPATKLHGDLSAYQLVELAKWVVLNFWTPDS